VIAFNLLLAVLWISMTGRPSLNNMVLGFVFGYTVLWLTRENFGPTRYFSKVPMAFALLGRFFYELIVANLRMAWDAATPGYSLRPAIVAVPLDAETGPEIMLLASLVTLTPGTLSLEISEDRRTLFVHAVYCDDPETLRRQIKHGFERPLLEVMR
jgi:multicomponent Na+:H+ antiporter subunit E